MKWIVKEYTNTEIEEVYEAFNGDLYFFSYPDENGDVVVYARLYSMPEFAEWGSGDKIAKKHILNAYGSGIWKVHKKNWGNLNSYEKELFNEVD